MFELYAKKNSLAVRAREMLTSGSVNVYPVRIVFSQDWDGLDRVAVFRAGGKSASVELKEDGTAVIPWEVLADPGIRLYGGVYGTKGETVTLSSVWADMGYIQQGATPGDEARPPTPELWKQALEGKGDRLAYTGTGELGLYAGEKLLSSVPIEGMGSGVSHKAASDAEVNEVLNEVFS